MNGKNYPPRGSMSGDCPICSKYQSRTMLTWRDKVFCCKEHMRQYMWETIAEETMDEYDDLFKELAEK